MNIRTWSLRNRLLLWLLISLIPLRCVSTYYAYRTLRESTIKAFDLGIEDSLNGFASFVKERNGVPFFDINKSTVSFIETNAIDDVYFQVLGTNGEYLGGNRIFKFPDRIDKEVQFAESTIDDEPVRIGNFHKKVEAAKPDQFVNIQVAQTLRGRKVTLYPVLIRLLAELIATITLIVLVVWGVVRKSLRTVDLVERIISKRDPMDFTPLPDNDLPLELAPLLQSLNSLLRRLEDDIQVQQRFLENAAHELKTPLTVLKTLIEFTIREKNPANQAELLLKISAAVNRTAHLSKKLLSLSNASAIKVRVENFTPCNLVAISQEVIVHYLEEAQTKHIDLGYEGPEEPVFVSGDPSTLYEMIANLVENALRYSGNQGHVSVIVKGGSVPEIHVVDTGPGIPKEAQERVFERFYRVLGTRVEGTGLGLAIVKEIADAHRAQVLILSDCNHPGTTFKIIFSDSLKKNPSPHRFQQEESLSGI